MKTPVTFDKVGAKVIISGSYALLDTTFGLQVKFDGVHHLQINVPGEYFNKVQSGLPPSYLHVEQVNTWSKTFCTYETFPNPFPIKLCGMCGNYNNIGPDDYLKPDKTLAKDAIELGNSWRSEGDDDEGSVSAIALILFYTANILQNSQHSVDFMLCPMS